MHVISDFILKLHVVKLRLKIKTIKTFKWEKYLSVCEFCKYLGVQILHSCFNCIFKLLLTAMSSDNFHSLRANIRK